MNESANDVTLTVGDVWLQAHRGVVLLLHPLAGTIALSDEGMDALCQAWLRHRIGAETNDDVGTETKERLCN